MEVNGQLQALVALSLQNKPLVIIRSDVGGLSVGQDAVVRQISLSLPGTEFRSSRLLLVTIFTELLRLNECVLCRGGSRK
jgi:hypothetical protein